MKKYLIIITILGLYYVVHGCKEPVTDLIFTNDFDNIPDRVWIGEDFWSIPLEDWQIRDGRLECTGNRPNMKANIITYDLKQGNGTINLRISCGLLHQSDTEGTVGFSIGVKDLEDPDVKAACYHGKGLNMGIRTEGMLFINDRMKEIPEDFNLEHFTLEIEGKFNSDGNQITLRVLDKENKEIGIIIEDGIDNLDGLIVLAVNHHVPRPYSNGPSFWFDDLEISGTKIRYTESNQFGAILWTMYTNSRNILKLTAQFAPVSTTQNDKVHFEILVDNEWQKIASTNIRIDSYTATFKVENWDPESDKNFRISYAETLKDGTYAEYEYTGTIRKEPVNKPLVLGGLTCQYGYGFPYTPLVKNLIKEDPDLLYFSGDQIYEGNGGYSIIRFPAEKAILNYLGKWYMFGWAFKDVMKDRPTICTPDDHDVFQGNLWGNDGKKIELEDWQRYSGTSGGYIEPPEMINVVHATQCSQLPDPYDPTPMEQNISTWYTDLVYGGVSFAIISDRIYKSGPNEVAFWDGRQDWIKDPETDLTRLDKPGLKLIGDRQDEFLNHWVKDWEGAYIKVLLSQTLFANIPTHHGNLDGILTGDLDSGGWPQTQRNKVVDLLRKCYAFHISGDQHLPLFVRYGIDDFSDAGWAFCTPAITVGYQRRFLPDRLGIQQQNRPDHGLANTGEYIGGMGHKNYIYAVGNLPDETRSEFRYERAQLTSSGYGIITFNQDSRDISCEAVRFLADAGQLKPEDQFPGWPVTVNQFENGGADRTGDTFSIHTNGLDNPVLLVYDAKSKLLLLSIRMKDNDFSGIVTGSGTYNIEIGNPESDNWKMISDISAEELKTNPVEVSF